MPNFGLGMLGGGGAIHLVFLLSNGGRILAGILGGWLASHKGKTYRKAEP
jgi:hypothetical protein